MIECAEISAHVFAYLRANWCMYETICVCACVYMCGYVCVNVICLYMHYVDIICMWMHIFLHIQVHMCV